MKIYFDVVGCRLNQSEAERAATIFRALGHEIVGEAEDADLAIINTCAVTVKAAADSRKKLRRAARLGAKRVVATGCWATLYPEAALNLPGVDDVIMNDEKESLVFKILDISPEIISQLSLIRNPLPGDRARTRAFIKVQEGCNNHCSYCLTRIARGKSHSRNINEIRRDMMAAAAGGAKEIVLTGVQLGAWGSDLPQPKKLDGLIREALRVDKVQRVRLSSIEPWDFDPAYLKLWEDERLCRQLHIPLQSGDDQILKAMQRPITADGYAELIHRVRKEVPDMALTTDVITGFPGETDEAFQETKAFLKKIKFAGGHVFTYSPRQGTAAYNMKNKVDSQIAKDRNAAVRQIFTETGREFRERFIGQTKEVLWESSRLKPEGFWELSGLTDTYIRVIAFENDDRWNQIDSVRLDAHHSSRPALMGSMID